MLRRIFYNRFNSTLYYTMSSILVFCLGCTQHSEVRKDTVGSFIVQKNNLSINKVQVIPWLGMGNDRMNVSRGIRLSFSLPNIEDKDLIDIAKDTGADHWLVRMRRSRANRQEDVGAIQIPLFHQPVNFKKPLGKTTRFELDLVYVAAYIISRFDAKTCPMVNHKKKITSVVVKDQPVLTETFSVSRINRKTYLRKVDSSGFTQHKFNGGQKLFGQYSLEIAFYNSKTKKVVSNYVSYPQHIFVEREKAVSLPKCQPDKSSEGKSTEDLIKEFRFGR